MLIFSLFSPFLSNALWTLPLSLYPDITVMISCVSLCPDTTVMVDWVL